mmetsp:Transcript_10707/g.28645  ORF Transcript_10707/g.28645 Transcript_10707/m.28645 type:complete len:372 (-) Transcript_10707:270-1385(-)
MAALSPFSHADAPAFLEAEAASSCLVGSHKRVWLPECASSSVSTASGEAHSEGTPTPLSGGSLSGRVGSLSKSPPGLVPFASDEPAYIRLDAYTSTDSASLGEAPSEMPMVVRSECSVSGHVWLLCQDPAGSRRVQDALDKCSSHEAREALLQELHGHAVKAMRDPHANHVLQKCISIMEPDSLQFMLDELLERDGLATTVARHRYGCRIVQQLLKKCATSQVSELAEALMQKTVKLARHSFGNFPVQRLLEFGTEEQRHRLAETIASNAETICRSRAGDGVIAAALEHASSDDKILVAKAVLLAPGLLIELAQGRHGKGAVMRILHVLDGQESLQAHMSLAMGIAALRASRHGRVVAKYLEEAALHTATQ